MSKNALTTKLKYHLNYLQDDIVKKIMEETGNAVGLAEGAMKRMTMVSDGGGLVNPNLNVPRPTLVSCVKQLTS